MAEERARILEFSPGKQAAGLYVPRGSLHSLQTRKWADWTKGILISTTRRRLPAAERTTLSRGTGTLGTCNSKTRGPRFGRVPNRRYHMSWVPSISLGEGRRGQHLRFESASAEIRPGTEPNKENPALLVLGDGPCA